MRKSFSFFAGLNGSRFAARRFKSLMDDTGSAIVEMALSSSVLFAMFFGMFEMSMASYTYHYVSDAAREDHATRLCGGQPPATTPD